MNGYERIGNVLAGRAADKVPVMLHNFMPAAHEAGYSMGEYRKDAGKMAASHIQAARKYGLDGILLDVDTCLEAGAVGVPVALLEDEPAVATGAASDDIDELIEMMNPDKLQKDERVKIYLESIHLMKKQVGDELWIRGNCDQMAFSLAMLAYGMQDFMADLLDEDREEKILELIGRAYDVHFLMHRLVMEAGADMTSFGDSSCGPALISRNMYIKYAYPFHKRLKKDLDNLGVQTVCHVCGNLDIIVEDIAGIGFTGVEMDPKSDIQKASEVLRGKSVMFGALDPTDIFYRGSPDKIKEQVRRVLDYTNGDGIIIGAGCALPALTPEENIRAFVEAVREYR